MADEENKQDEQSTEQPVIKADDKSSDEPKKVDDLEQKAQEKKNTEIPKEFEKIVDQLDKMSALEVSKFVKFLEEHWGVSAAAPTVAVAASGGSEAGAPAADEKSEYDVMLKDAGAQKVAVIKAVKDVTGLGLGEAKALVDGAPKAIKEKVAKDEAEEAKAALEAAGATVELV